MPPGASARASLCIILHLACCSAAQSAVSNLALGGTSGFTAASICYPLDTIRRRMQMAGHMYDGQLDAFRKIWEQVLSLGLSLAA